MFWGLDQFCCIYRSVICSQLDWGSLVYSSTQASIVKALDPVHHRRLQSATNSFHTSPMLSVCTGDKEAFQGAGDSTQALCTAANIPSSPFLSEEREFSEIC